MKAKAVGDLSQCSESFVMQGIYSYFDPQIRTWLHDQAISFVKAYRELLLREEV